ncbi:response regulator transcription factor [Pedobacter caeni]|uniref:Regulatory protein, luxR family n=1 Tax=Pedobacter caeni TaxID=288992 RepID=A0A1M4U3Q9_9SPHI|nr:helix-turn-helix transcriptional regulator [Pedobacter caeni]SHE51276.1 regulatory protein, luxR family [Pedobacter caeni]
MNLVTSSQIEQVTTCQSQVHAIARLIMQKKFQANEIGDYVIGNVLVENQNCIDHINIKRCMSEFSDQNNREAEQFWLPYFEFFFPPEESIVIDPELFDAISHKEHRKVHFFFQRIRPKNKLDYRWYFSTSRLCLTECENVDSILFHYAFELIKPECHAMKMENPMSMENPVNIENGIRTEEEDYSQKYCTRVLLLSKREKDIIKLIVEGKSSFEIAEKLYISIHTVNNHRKNIIRKLEINNLCQLTKFAILFKII